MFLQNSSLHLQDDSKVLQQVQITKLKAISQIILIGFGFSLLEYSGFVYSKQQLIAEAEYSRELTFFSVYFTIRSVITILTPYIFMKLDIKKLLIISGILQIFSGIFCIFTQKVFCVNDKNEEGIINTTCPYLYVDTAIGGICQGIANGMFFVIIGILIRSLYKKSNLRPGVLTGIFSFVLGGISLIRFSIENFIDQTFFSNNRPILVIICGSVGIIIYAIVNSEICSCKEYQKVTVINQNGDQEEVFLKPRIKEMFKRIYQQDRFRSWAVFNCFCALILGFYGNSIYFFVHSSILKNNESSQEEKEVLNQSYFIQHALAVAISFLVGLFITKSKYITVAYLQILLFEIALFICLFNVVSCQILLSKIISYITGISQGFYNIVFYLVGFYAFKGSIEYFACFSFMYSVSNGFIYIFVTVFSMIDNEKVNESPLIIPQTLIALIYSIKFLLIIIYFYIKRQNYFGKSTRSSESSDIEIDLIEENERLNTFTNESSIKQSIVIKQQHSGFLTDSNTFIDHGINRGFTKSDVYGLKSTRIQSQQTSQDSNVYSYLIDGEEFFQKFIKIGNEKDTFLGQGSKGSVYKYQLRDFPDNLVAIKITMGSNQQEYENLMQEIQTIIRIQGYKNIVRVLNYTVLQQISSFQIFLAMELADCTLYSEIKERKIQKQYFSQQQIMHLSKELIDVLGQLQQKEDITHRDLKPQNILKIQGDYKLADFGEAKLFTLENITKDPTIRGTIKYLSPELRQNHQIIEEDEENSEEVQISNLQNWDSFKSDVFSLGLTILEAATLSSINSFNLIQDKLEKGIEKLKLMEEYDDQFKTLVEKMLTWDPIKRPTFSMLIRYLEKNKSIQK